MGEPWKYDINKASYFMIPFISTIQNSQIHRDKQANSSCQKCKGSCLNNYFKNSILPVSLSGVILQSRTRSKPWATRYGAPPPPTNKQNSLGRERPGGTETRDGKRETALGTF